MATKRGFIIIRNEEDNEELMRSIPQDPQGFHKIYHSQKEALAKASQYAGRRQQTYYVAEITHEVTPIAPVKISRYGG